MAEYYAVSKGELAHSKGKWKKHKYIRKEGDRYIYPDSDGLVSSIRQMIPGTRKPVSTKDKVWANQSNIRRKNLAGARSGARAHTGEKVTAYTKKPSTARGGLSAGPRGNTVTRAYNSARKEVGEAYRSGKKAANSAYKSARKEVGEAYRSGKKAARKLGRKIDNTRIGTSVTTLRDNPNSKPYYRKETPYRVKDLRRGIAKSANAARKNASKAVRDAGRKIDNTRIGTSVTTLRDNPNSKPYYRKETPYRVKDLRRGITKSAKAARKNATRSIKRGRNYIKKKLRR